MKILSVITIAVIFIVLTFFIVIQSSAQNQSTINPEDQTLAPPLQALTDNVQEQTGEEISADDYDIFTRKQGLSHKLPSLSKREEIIWVFKLTKKSVFL